MGDYRLSVASAGETKKLSDRLCEPYRDKITAQIVHAFADAFLRITGTARDEAIVTDAEIVELRAEIGTRLRPHKGIRYIRNERVVLTALGRCTEPTPSARIAEMTQLPRPTVNAALYSLRQKGAVRAVFQDRRNGTYELTEKAAEFRSPPAETAQ